MSKLTESPREDKAIGREFQADDADVIFLSSDNVIFKVHSKNLETACGGFPPSELKTAEGEKVSLTEDGETLDYLFSFIYPREYPQLLDIPFDLLVKIAEAAEKYDVFSAIEICKIRLREKIPENAPGVFFYSLRHDDTELMEASLPVVLTTPHEIAINMQIDKAARQLQYRLLRKSKIIETFTQAPSDFGTDHYLTENVLAHALRIFLQGAPDRDLGRVIPVVLQKAMRLNGFVEISAVSAVYAFPDERFFDSITIFQEALDQKIGEIPPLVTYLRSY